MDWRRYIRAAALEGHYLFQKATKIGFDARFEQEIGNQADEYLSGTHAIESDIPSVQLDSVELDNHDRFAIFRHDVYRRFEADHGGVDLDKFGRSGRWVPRGITVYYDQLAGTFVKVFDRYAATQGEARFLRDAIDEGLYRFLCPNLEYLIEDEDHVLRGYAIREGRPLSRFQFERYVGVSLREVILHETERTGLYFNDLEFHNVVMSDGTLSIIDLESVLPVSWFGTDSEFAIRHLDEVDVGWPIQSKWCSPSWYGDYLRQMAASAA